MKSQANTGYGTILAIIDSSGKSRLIGYIETSPTSRSFIWQGQIGQGISVK